MVRNTNKVSNRETDSRNVKWHRLNHAEAKQWFIDLGFNETENTGKSYENIMYKISAYELDFHDSKDTCEFSYSELMEMFKTFMTTTPSSLSVYLSVIRKYIAFCIQNGHTEKKINYLDNLTSEKLRTLVSTEVVLERYISREDLYCITKKELKNIQDIGMITTIYEGIRGKANEELINLKWKDIDFEKNIVKTNRKEYQANPEFVEILKKVNECEDYIAENGNSTSDKKKPELDILSKWDSEYLFRPLKERYRGAGEPKLTTQTVQRRILESFKLYLDKPIMSLGTLYISGLVDRAINFSREKLGREMLSKEFQKWLKDNDEKVNLNDTITIYRLIYRKKYDNMMKTK